jgi:hypothetical protein
MPSSKTNSFSNRTVHGATWADNSFRELATVCLPWQHWFDYVDQSAFHSCFVVDLWQSLSEWHLLLSACVSVCRGENVGAWNTTAKLFSYYTNNCVGISCLFTGSSPPVTFIYSRRWRKYWKEAILMTLMTSAVIQRQLWRSLHKTSFKIALKGGLGAGTRA